MMKTLLLAGTMAVAGPALAQTAPAPAQTSPAPAASAATPAQTTPAPAATAAPTQTQVAAVVDQQFGTYDKDADGALSKAEFGAWMTALKTQANAKTATAAEEKAWNDAAFRQADGDKSATVSKVELTGFLVKGASGAS